VTETRRPYFVRECRRGGRLIVLLARATDALAPLSRGAQGSPEDIDRLRRGESEWWDSLPERRGTLTFRTFAGWCEAEAWLGDGGA
jgi:hypothetical protein